MLRMFAPIVVIPPSPNMTPWTISTSVRMNTAANGEPRTIATSAPPTKVSARPHRNGEIERLERKDTGRQNRNQW